MARSLKGSGPIKPSVDSFHGQLRHHVRWSQKAQFHISDGVHAVRGQVVAQQQRVHGVLKRDAQHHALEILRGVHRTIVLGGQSNGLTIGVLGKRQLRGARSVGHAGINRHGHG